MATPSHRRIGLASYYAILVPVLLLAAMAAIATGSTPVSWPTILQVAAGKLVPGWVSSASDGDTVIVWLIRIPRVVVAGLVGSALAVAGVIMQSLFRNPLAEPGTTGAGAGAVVGAVTAFAFGWTAHSSSSLPLSAIVGAAFALGLVYAMATRGGVTPVATLLLAGIAVSSLLVAVYSLLISLMIANWQSAQEIVFWMMGGLEARTWTHVWLCAPFVIAGLAIALAQARELDLLQQGEETAAAFGVDVEPAKRLLTLTAALLTGASVAVAGSVGFVGLVVPHGVRMVLGPGNRALLPASAIAGAAFLIICDLIARTIHPPLEIRLGVVTSLVGGPIFVALLLRRYREFSAA